MCTNNNSDFCKHILYYIDAMGIDINLLDYWNKIKDDIFLQLISNNINNEELWKIVKETVFDAECGMCSNPISMNIEYHMCDICKNLTHAKCYRKWESKKKGCMYCRN